MKKNIIHQLQTLAKALPETWETLTPENVIYSGKDLKLCQIGKSDIYDPAKFYSISMPVIIQTNHLEKLKDGVKKNGLIFITTYTKRVLAA